MDTSRELLWRLIGERLEPGADREQIDSRILELFEETWTVAFTDLVGFSRRTREFGILHFLSLIYEKGRLLKGRIEEGGGRILKEEADSWLIVFRNPVRALETVLDCQRICAEHNQGRSEEDRIELCVGLGHGPVLRIGDEDVWGREVNAASRLGEDTAEGGQVLVTDPLRRAVADELSGLSYEPLEVPRIPDTCWRVVSG